MNQRQYKLRVEITYFKEAVELKKNVCMITAFHREGLTFVGGEDLCKVQGRFYLRWYRKIHDIVPLNGIFYKIINNCQSHNFKIGSVQHTDKFFCIVIVSNSFIPGDSLLN